MNPQVSIIVPTYNETENLLALVERIDKALSPAIDYEVVIVDDDSPDGTAAVANNLSQKYPIRVIVRKEARGLASAVVQGFRCAKAQTLTVIDADLQHPPEIIPQLLTEIWRGADIAISSRYTAGGDIPQWSIQRKLISQVAVLIAKAVLPNCRGITDPLSGFFAVAEKTIKNVELHPTGYKILLEVLALGHYNKVIEIPYSFGEREKGRTKYNVRETVNYCKHIVSLARRTGELNRVLKFILVGLSGVVVNEGLLYLLTSNVGLFYLVSSVAAVQAAILNNFIWNHLWTFRDRRTINESVWHRLGKFELVSIAGKLTNVLVLYLVVTFSGIQYLIANLIGIVIAFLVNFLANNMWTWRK